MLLHHQQQQQQQQQQEQRGRVTGSTSKSATVILQSDSKPAGQSSVCLYINILPDHAQEIHPIILPSLHSDDKILVQHS